MKKLFMMVAALMMTVSASAHTPKESDSWSTIKKHYSRVIYKIPTISTDNAGVVSAFSVCKEGDYLRTKDMLTRCVDWRRTGGDGQRVCDESEQFYGIAAIEGTKERCTKWRHRGKDRERLCFKYETYHYSLPLSFEIDVHRKNGTGKDRDESFGRKLFTKTLSIEDCE